MLEKWDLCFVIYTYSKITLRRGYKLDKFVLFSTEMMKDITKCCYVLYVKNLQKLVFDH